MRAFPSSFSFSGVMPYSPYDVNLRALRGANGAHHKATRLKRLGDARISRAHALISAAHVLAAHVQSEWRVARKYANLRRTCWR